MKKKMFKTIKIIFVIIALLAIILSLTSCKKETVIIEDNTCFELVMYSNTMELKFGSYTHRERTKSIEGYYIITREYTYNSFNKTNKKIVYTYIWESDIQRFFSNKNRSIYNPEYEYDMNDNIRVDEQPLDKNKYWFVYKKLGDLVCGQVNEDK